MQPSPRITIPLTILAALAVGFGLHALQATLLPFVVALFLSKLFHPLVIFLRKHHVPMAVAIILVLLIVGIGLFGIAAVGVSSVQSLTEALPKYGARWNTQLLPQILELLRHAPDDVQAQVKNLQWSNIVQGSSIVGIISGAAGSFLDLVSGLALILLFMLFILAGSGAFLRKIEMAYPPEHSVRVSSVIKKVEEGVQRYLLMVTAINIVSGISMSLILAAFGVDLALLWGVMAFLLTYIPTIGSLLALVLPIIVAFLQFDSLTTPILVSISLIVTQLALLSVISPKVMGKGLNLSPLLILIALIFWGWVWGGWGMIVSVPITATLRILFENIEATRPLAILMSADPSKIHLVNRVLRKPAAA